MQDDLTPPADLSDLAALADWSQRIGSYFASLGHDAGQVAAARLHEVLGAEAPDAETVEAAVRETAAVLVRAGLESSLAAYRQLLAPTEKLLGELDPQSDEHEKVHRALETYRLVVELFENALSAMERGGPEGKAQMEQAVAEAKQRLAAQGPIGS